MSPTRRLYDLFWGIHNMKEQNPDDVVALAAEHNIHFLPPPPAWSERSVMACEAQQSQSVRPAGTNLRIAFVAALLGNDGR